MGLARAGLLASVSFSAKCSFEWVRGRCLGQKQLMWSCTSDGTSESCAAQQAVELNTFCPYTLAKKYCQNENV